MILETSTSMLDETQKKPSSLFSTLVFVEQGWTKRKRRLEAESAVEVCAVVPLVLLIPGVSLDEGFDELCFTASDGVDSLSLVWTMLVLRSRNSTSLSLR
jgi:hypothetical protein